MAALAPLLDGIPWAIPGVLVAAVLAALFARPVGRRLGDNALTAWALMASVGLILAITLTPSVDVFDASGCDLDLTPISLAGLLTLNDRSLNVALFLPLGLAIGALRPRHQGVWVVAAAALAPAIELIQLLLFPLMRTCQATDLLDNWLGLVLGLAAGGIASWAWRKVGPGRSGARRRAARR